MPGPGPYVPRTRSGAPTGISIDLYYGMVTAGLDRVTQGLAMDLQASNVAVNCLSPQGAVRTPAASTGLAL